VTVNLSSLATSSPGMLAYLGGIVRGLQGRLVAANSLPDPVHLLLRLPPSVAVARALRVVKTNSSRWVHQTRTRLRGFAWQTGYGAFRVSQPNAASVAGYIREQEKHHQRVTFQEEFIGFLRKNGERYRERYIWE
jgi:REP-associated tyrosine transposase